MRRALVTLDIDQAGWPGQESQQSEAWPPTGRVFGTIPGFDFAVFVALAKPVLRPYC